MRALDRKLFRDIKRLWAQSLAVAFDMAAGVATIFIGFGAYYSLSEARSAYYDRAQFADVFAFALRAKLTKITTGQIGSSEVQVLGGLSEGQTVIVHPSDLIADDVRIEIRDCALK